MHPTAALCPCLVMVHRIEARRRNSIAATLDTAVFCRRIQLVIRSALSWAELKRSPLGYAPRGPRRVGEALSGVAVRQASSRSNSPRIYREIELRLDIDGHVRDPCQCLPQFGRHLVVLREPALGART